MEITAQQVQVKLAELAKVTPKSKAVFYKTGKGDYAEHDRFIGVSVPDLRKIAKKAPNMNFSDLQILLNSKFNEERLIALLILTNQYLKIKDRQLEIYQFYMANLSQVNNWNLVDASAHLIIGAHLHNQQKDVLFALARSAIMWKRRIAIVATWYFIKNSQYETTLEIAETLLGDDQDLIHKASGWMLREVGKKDVNTLEKFLEKFSTRMPHAIEKFPEADRKLYLQFR